MPKDALPPELHDLARLYATEHLIRILFTELIVRGAEGSGASHEAVAREWAKGVDGTLVEGRMPIELRELIRGKVRELMSEVVDNAVNMDLMTKRT